MHMKETSNFWLVLAAMVVVISIVAVSTRSSDEDPGAIGDVERSAAEHPQVALGGDQEVTASEPTVLTEAESIRERAVDEAPDNPDAVELGKIAKTAMYWMKFQDSDEARFRSYCLKRMDTPDGLSKEQLHAVNQVYENYDVQLLPMAEDVVERARLSFEDYYGNARFPKQHASMGMIEQRPTGDSVYASEAAMEIEGWSCDVGFRSADYPALNSLLQEAIRLRRDRDLELMTIIEQK
jgi:hypothetical protein